MIATDQKGFTLIEGLLVSLVLLVLGFGGWYVYQSNKSEDVSEVTATDVSSEIAPEVVEDETADWESYSRYSVTLKYPEDWTVDPQDSVQSQATYLYGPDYSFQTGDIVSDTLAQGSSITFDVSNYTNNSKSADDFEEKHLKNNPNGYSGFEKIEVNGRTAVQFRYNSDGEDIRNPTTVFFLDDGKKLTFNIDTFTESTKQEALETYQKIVRTVEY